MVHGCPVADLPRAVYATVLMQLWVGLTEMMYISTSGMSFGQEITYTNEGYMVFCDDTGARIDLRQFCCSLNDAPTR